MKKNQVIMVTAMLLYAMAGWSAERGSPNCNGLGENYVGWPTANPVWEMCYLAPADSSATQGSSLEIRQVYYNGHLVLERSHVPMLFANYATNTCYRDWKNSNSEFILADQEENPTSPAITACDASVSTTNPVGSCPFGLSGNCGTGVQVEKYPDRLLLTTNHVAGWYEYTARYVFYADGRFQPRFGFGNRNGTFSNTTHWHHAYWRLNFDINGAANDEVYIVDDQGEKQQTVEFHDFREITSGQPNDPNSYADEVTWMIKDSLTQRGYVMVPGFEGDSQQGFIDDYDIGPDPSMDGYHNIDVMVSNYRLFFGGTMPEYSDTPGENNLSDCAMDEEKIIDGGSLIGVDSNPVFWYRTAVEDIQNAGMLCKTGGPMFHPVGDWSPNVAPTAVSDVMQVVENSIDNELDVLANDTDPDGGVKAVSSVMQPSNGVVTIGVDGEHVIYTPDVDYCNEGNATDDFSYTLNGGSMATVAVTVTCVDTLPTAVDDDVALDENSVDVIIDVVSNDIDPDGGPKFIASVTQPVNGTVTIGNAADNVAYSPLADYCNDGVTTDDFTYQLNGGSAARVAVTVNCLGPSDVIFADGFD